MNRKNFFKNLLALTWPLPLVGAKKQEKVCFPVRNIWESPQGQYVLALRAELKRLDHWDDLAEDWQEVEDALKNGCLLFFPRVSRLENIDQHTKRQLYSIMPMTFIPRTYKGPSTYFPENNDLVKHLELSFSRH